MNRIANRLCAFVLSLVVLTVFIPSDAQAQMCVRYARMLTSFTIQGDAWTWWEGAVGRYQRGLRPAAGSVLVFRRTGHLHYGHVAVVSRVVDRRTILVDHSWLEGDVLHRGMKVVDTSPNNSWSSVRVWNDPSSTLGLRTFPTFGFVYPRGGRHDGFDAPLAVAAADADTSQTDDAVGAAPAVRAPRTRMAAAPSAYPVFVPHHKPLVAQAQAATPAPSGGFVVAYLPPHKPVANTTPNAPQKAPHSTPHGIPVAMALTQVPQVAVPQHKPGSYGAHQSHTQVAELHARNANTENGD